MMSSLLSLYANSTNKNNQQKSINHPHESFAEQIISLNKAIRTEYIKLSEQSAPPAGPVKKTPKPTTKSPKKKTNQ